MLYLCTEIRNEYDLIQLDRPKRDFDDSGLGDLANCKNYCKDPQDCYTGDLPIPSRAESCNRSVGIAKGQGRPVKNYVCAHPSYLITLGQTHSDWIFGAVAELVDNSRDAQATKYMFYFMILLFGSLSIHSSDLFLRYGKTLL